MAKKQSLKQEVFQKVDAFNTLRLYSPDDASCLVARINEGGEVEVSHNLDATDAAALRDWLGKVLK